MSKIGTNGTAKRAVQPSRNQEAGDHWLTDLLAQHVMSWKVGRGRYLKAKRSWIPKWRFAPLTRVEDAFQLLNRASRDYQLTATEGCGFIAEVRVGDRTGKASGEPKSRTITTALAIAVGLASPNEVAVPASVLVHRGRSRSRSNTDGI